MTGKRDWLSATKWIVGLSVVLTEILFIYFYKFSSVEFVVSSAFVTVAVLIQLRYGIQSNAPVPADIVVFIFSWLFLDLAPKIQLIGDPRHLVNTAIVVPSQVFLANVLCSFFIVTFTLTYSLMSRRAAVTERVATHTRTEFSAFGVFLAVAMCVIVVVVLGPFAYRSLGNVTVGGPLFLVMGRFLLFLPSATLLILLNETSRRQSSWIFSRVAILMLLGMLVLVTENPLTEKRNALGPVYISIALVAFRQTFGNQNRRFLLLIAAMVLMFPAIEEFTHNRYQVLHGVKIAALIDQIVTHYQSVNYDAWANINTSIDIIGRQGLQWGHQLLGSILFFVPSSAWPSKPLATGLFVGNFLMENYRMWFNNLSAPLIAEGYLDFGVIGVTAYAAALGFAVYGLNRLATTAKRWIAEPFTTYLAIYLMFLLRGSLMVAVAFGVGAIAAFYSASALLSIGSKRQLTHGISHVDQLPANGPHRLVTGA
jgi:hypothetical protein